MRNIFESHILENVALKPTS